MIVFHSNQRLKSTDSKSFSKETTDLFNDSINAITNAFEQQQKIAQTGVTVGFNQFS